MEAAAAIAFQPSSPFVTAVSFAKEEKTAMAQLVSTVKYVRYAMGSLSAVLFLVCCNGS
jgi:hypothetical protein